MNILEIIKANSNVSSGIPVVDIAKKAALPLDQVKPLLKELHTAGKITVREGINHPLIFLK